MKHFTKKLVFRASIQIFLDKYMKYFVWVSMREFYFFRYKYKDKKYKNVFTDFADQKENN